MTTIFKHIIAVILLSIVFGCNDDNNNCVSETVVPIDTVLAASTIGNVNQPITITVNFTVNNGCGAFNRFIENRNGHIITVDVEARFTGCICTLALQELTEVYSFTVDTPGDYELRFVTVNGAFIPINLTFN
jgi:hypothetical protein